MNARRASLVYLLLLALLSVLLATSAYGPTPRPAPPGDRDGAVLPDLAGTWIGTWQDTIYFVGGDLSFEITSTPGGYTAVGSIDLSVLGAGVQEGTAAGTVAGNQLDFTFNADGIGDGMGSLVDNAATGSGTTDTPPVSFGDFTFAGTANGQAIWGSFDFTAPTGGAGKALLYPSTSTRETSLSAVKAHYDAP